MNIESLDRIMTDAVEANKLRPLSELSRILRNGGVLDRDRETYRRWCTREVKSPRGEPTKMKSAKIGGHTMSTIAWFVEYVKATN
jgi:hypothetical protein